MRILARSPVTISQGEEKDRNRNKLLVRRACVAYGAWMQAPKDPK